MDTLLVEGLDGQGPGDVVGAFVGEADVSPQHIGEIDLRDGTAHVEVAEEVRQRVIDAMDGNRVGTAEVRVHPAGSKQARVREHVDRYQHLVELEREERCAATRRRSAPRPGPSARPRAAPCCR